MDKLFPDSRYIARKEKGYTFRYVKHRLKSSSSTLYMYCPKCRQIITPNPEYTLRNISGITIEHCDEDILTVDLDSHEIHWHINTFPTEEDQEIFWDKRLKHD